MGIFRRPNSPKSAAHLSRLQYLVCLVGFTLLALPCPALGLCPALGKSPGAVTFDVPAIVVAEALDPAVATAPTTGGALLRVRMTVSTMISPSFQGQVDEFVVEVASPSQALRVIDFWPKNELYSQVDGSISVENHVQKNQNLAFSVSGGYEPFARGAADGDYHSQHKLDESYQRRPPMQLLTSSGTIGRGYGVFFKFRPGAVPILEGDREIAMLVEAPSGWRGDLLHISMRAAGVDSSGFSNREPRDLGSTQLWIAAHRGGDASAAQAARRFVATEQAVRRLAATNHANIQHRSLPTVFHKVGAALDVIDPKIPNDFLTQILFNLDHQYFNATTSRLPVDLRVAALDYWDQRAHLLKLSSTGL